ncbi:MAG: hypothetical protein D3910_21765 [Candidatus Electrothrix sp. ATG2]|nr:hypothetical protein [Candidatus Electrothrix sp. ATG2]
MTDRNQGTGEHRGSPYDPPNRRAKPNIGHKKTAKKEEMAVRPPWLIGLSIPAHGFCRGQWEDYREGRGKSTANKVERKKLFSLRENEKQQRIPFFSDKKGHRRDKKA